MMVSVYSYRVKAELDDGCIVEMNAVCDVAHNVAFHCCTLNSFFSVSWTNFAFRSYLGTVVKSDDERNQ